MRHLFHIPLLLLLLSSCFGKSAPSAADTALLLVDSIIDDRPDSALTLLRAIDTTAFVHPESRPLYALLFTQAEDKNFIDRTSDTLISRATAYYSRHPRLSPTRLIRAHYYHARILLNARNYPLSLIHLRQAEELALPDSAHHLLGLIYRNMSDIYGWIHHSPERLKYAQEAYKHFRAENAPLYYEYAEAEIGRALIACRQFNEALKILQKASHYPTILDNTSQIAEVNRCIGYCYFALKDFKKAAEYIEESIAFEPDNFDEQAYAILAESYMQINDTSNARKAVEKYNSLFHTGKKFIAYSNIRDYKEAYDILQRDYNDLDSIYAIQTYQTVTQTSNDYLTLQNELQIQKNRADRQKSALIIAILSAIFLVIIFIGISSYLKQRRKLNIAVDEAEDIMQTLKSAIDNGNQKSEIIKSLIGSYYHQLSSLCETYYQTIGNKAAERMVANSVIHTIENFKIDSGKLQELEDFLNDNMNGIASDFYNGFPKLNEKQRALFVYSAVGFSSRAIAVLLGEKPETIFVWKSRLKKKLLNQHIHVKLN